jgi:2-hydroxychromene-2-carboxylate isomerase
VILALISPQDKDKWINVERERWAKYFSVPIVDNPPEGFPPRTLAVQRALCVVSQKTPTKLPSVIEALYHSFWVQSNFKIGEPAGFAPIIASVLGQDATKEVLSVVSRESSRLIVFPVLTYCPDDTA